MLILHSILDKVIKILDFQSKTLTEVIMSSIITFVKVLVWKSEIFTTLSSIGYKLAFILKYANFHHIQNKVAKISDFYSKTFTKDMLKLIITTMKVLDWKSEIFITLSSIGHKISICIKTC